MDNLTFNADNHEYRLHGVRLPSVTQIIADAGLYGDTAYFTDYSRDRGSFIHEAIEYHLSGELDEETLDPVIVPYLDAWKKFQAEANYVSDSCEERLASDVYHFAGTIDHIGHLGGHFSIIDVKTSVVASAAEQIQTAAYELLLSARGARRFSLHLANNGRYKLIEHTDRIDGKIFLSCLAVYYFKQNNNIK
jgi:hypothetical protein